eukprot:gene10957-14674_t
MRRPVEDRIPLPDLDDPAEIHHRHAMADMPHGPEIVGDEHDGQPQMNPNPLPIGDYARAP